MPDDVEYYYFPNYLTLDEADELYKYLMSKKDEMFEQQETKYFGKVFRQPRLVMLMGRDYTYGGYNRRARPMDPKLNDLIEKLMTDVVIPKRPGHDCLNTVVGNLYRNGKDNIAAHSDNEKTMQRDSLICSISLGAPRDFVIYRTGDKKTKEPNKRLFSVELTHGSLFVMGKNFQQKLLHGIPPRKKIEKPRINLTFRVSS